MGIALIFVFRIAVIDEFYIMVGQIFLQGLRNFFPYLYRPAVIEDQIYCQLMIFQEVPNRLHRDLHGSFLGIAVVSRRKQRKSDALQPIGKSQFHRLCIGTAQEYILAMTAVSPARAYRMNNIVCLQSIPRCDHGFSQFTAADLTASLRQSLFAGCQKNAPAGSPALTEPDI